MGLYWITIVDASGRKMEGARAITSDDLDFVFNHFLNKAAATMGSREQIRYYDCMMISRNSPKWKEYQQQQAQRRGPGKYRPMRG
ncbi:hypothetical protein [Flavihumibacter petaseus]|uniref:Uncharacterized protein n=1 Tax=Flavihumibacter petaseus NBRC 106054 TaxID=1220578 RepID=A0A0E9MZZ8_9BACT|nr:hypothetical protein [Flavihumibacter petaseus]GAO43144.1 hypothetical protein FPE01S_02_02480 [Flavihumibacter petaseus NBRC 106054]